MSETLVVGTLIFEQKSDYWPLGFMGYYSMSIGCCCCEGMKGIVSLLKGCWQKNLLLDRG